MFPVARLVFRAAFNRQRARNYLPILVRIRSRTLRRVLPISKWYDLVHHQTRPAYWSL
jgi:hypothetical protein